MAGRFVARPLRAGSRGRRCVVYCRGAGEAVIGLGFLWGCREAGGPFFGRGYDAAM